MTKIRIALKTFLLIIATFSSFGLQAMAPMTKKDAEFVFAVFATTRSRAALLNKAAEQNILAYNINSESTIDFENNVVKNVWIRKNHKWARLAEAPLPDVVYDFGVYKQERVKKAKAKILVAQLREHNIPFINPEAEMSTVNDKLLFSEIMNDSQIPHPRTLIFSKKNLKSMLAEQNILFIKPTFGSKGQGIIVVEKSMVCKKPLFSVTYKLKKNGRWVTIRKEKITERKIYSAIEDAKIALRTKKARYIIQQGIDIFSYDGKQTDFRVNVQRSKNNELLSSGLFMRVGGNLSQGGRPAGYQYALKPLAEKIGSEPEDIKNHVVDVSVKTHRAIEKYAKTPIGDLGMDIVVDNEGKAYVIEANTKNGFVSRHVQKNPLIDGLYGLPEFYQESVKVDNDHELHLIEYARYLVGQKNKG